MKYDFPHYVYIFVKIFMLYLVQMHWNNPLEFTHYTDGSGLVIYYTSNLRNNDEATLFLGQMYKHEYISINILLIK